MKNKLNTEKAIGMIIYIELYYRTYITYYNNKIFVHNIFCITLNKILQFYYSISIIFIHLLLYISESLKEAKEKAKKAQLTTDLDTSADEQPKRSLGSAKKKYVPPPTFSENSAGNSLLLNVLRMF